MEIEFKFCIPPAQLAAVTAAVRRGRHTPIRMEARYFDTPDAALSSRGIALRLRREGDRWVQTVKALGDGPLDRHEHNVERGPASPAGAPALQPGLHAGSPAGDILVRALQGAAGPLAETYGTEMDRITRDIRFAGGMAELALDTGRVVARRGTPQQQEARICELELELKSGPVAGLARLADTWAQQHGLVLSTISKAERGERLLAPQWVRPAVSARPLRAGSAAPLLLDAAHLQRAVLSHCLVQILGNASEIVETTLPTTDLAEHVHQLRIGIRRLRTALRELDALAPGRFAPHWEPALRDVFQRLGSLRDREQILRAINAELRDAGAPASLLMPLGDTPEHAAADIVRTPAFQSALVDLMGFTADKAEPTDGAQALPPKDVRRTLQKKLQSLRTQVLDDGRRIDTLAAPAQHRLRKRLKRLRYLAEFLVPAFDGDEGDAFLQSLRPALAALGRLHDERVASDLYTEIATRDARAWFGVGWLAARRQRTTTVSRKALARIGEVPRLRKAKVPKASKAANAAKAAKAHRA
ncbi:CYTH and CHAD domain-containing protein [Acidovorax sp. sic0104]|uniref:CYTH and CHAD domain-containing protein n=1 Tax=Acidovorax sp. sic0104 TaxID=2854784 RepID=UPI001C450A28|nr:CYTH and CHAD domain-containing protein [Acidovorax sp. sic0104]MBV7543094.1 CYTH and CHAD domain-containing protein [Acidovorax sp. sic0104]